MRYKAVIFDLDDTLYDYESLNIIATEAVKHALCSKLSIDTQTFNTLYKNARENVKILLAHTASSHNRLLYFQSLLEELSAYTPAFCLELYDIYWDCFLNKMTLRNGVMDCLDMLRSKAVKIAICTDLTAHIQHRKLIKLDLKPDVVVTSEEAGKEKPDPLIFELCLNKLGVKASDCVFVGDSMEKDVIGAARVGMTAIHFNTNIHQSTFAPYSSVSSFDELSRRFNEAY